MSDFRPVIPYHFILCSALKNTRAEIVSTKFRDQEMFLFPDIWFFFYLELYLHAAKSPERIRDVVQIGKLVGKSVGKTVEKSLSLDRPEIDEFVIQSSRVEISPRIEWSCS